MEELILLERMTFNRRKKTEAVRMVKETGRRGGGVK